MDFEFRQVADLRLTLALSICLVFCACGGPSEDASATDRSSSSAADAQKISEARPAQPSSPDATQPRPSATAEPEAISIMDARLPLEVRILTDYGYDDQDGIRIMDVLEGDYVYFSVAVEDAEGRAVNGVKVDVAPSRDSVVAPIADKSEFSEMPGNYSFMARAGSMGEDSLTIRVGKQIKGLILNVISIQAAGYAKLPEAEGAVDWNLLFEAEIEWGDQITAKFPDQVAALNGTEVRLVGFMLPLEMTEKQKHFVLASSPPSCFFHVPGGPAGAVEVFTKKSISAGFDPIVLEGKFETQAVSDDGVVYRLRDARLVK